MCRQLRCPLLEKVEDALSVHLRWEQIRGDIPMSARYRVTGRAMIRRLEFQTI